MLNVYIRIGNFQPKGNKFIPTHLKFLHQPFSRLKLLFINLSIYTLHYVRRIYVLRVIAGQTIQQTQLRRDTIQKKKLLIVGYVCARDIHFCAMSYQQTNGILCSKSQRNYVCLQGFKLSAVGAAVQIYLSVRQCENYFWSHV